ncbi:hypothetical protein BU14_1449s0002, partial [Porphyra umbilicalis]
SQSGPPVRPQKWGLRAGALPPPSTGSCDQHSPASLRRPRRHRNSHGRRHCLVSHRACWWRWWDHAVTSTVRHGPSGLRLRLDDPRFV